MDFNSTKLDQLTWPPFFTKENSEKEGVSNLIADFSDLECGTLVCSKIGR